jgi:hypothetical protein
LSQERIRGRPLNVGMSPEPGKIPIMWWGIPVNEIDFEATRSPAITNKFVNWPLILAEL